VKMPVVLDACIVNLVDGDSFTGHLLDLPGYRRRKVATISFCDGDWNLNFLFSLVCK
jgi:hypothetical protein